MEKQTYKHCTFAFVTNESYKKIAIERGKMDPDKAVSYTHLKELSLHYQSFYMEAMSLMMRLLIKNNIEVPATWKPMLEKMCTYVADCMGDYGEVVVFGDDDEGKILDLQGGMNHYQYVLGMFSIMLDKQYTKLKGLECENLRWLFSVDERNIAQEKPLYLPPLSACYREGGNTVLRLSLIHI